MKKKIENLLKNRSNLIKPRDFAWKSWILERFSKASNLVLYECKVECENKVNSSKEAGVSKYGFKILQLSFVDLNIKQNFEYL